MSRTQLTPMALAVALASVATAVQAENLTPNLQVNGFLTAGATTVTDDFNGRYMGGSDPRAGFDEQGSFKIDNVFGLQLSYQLNEKIDLVGQLISQGAEGYDTRAEWAYAAYRVNDNLRLRAGRFALPLYMYSESIHVGQSYAWARLPVELYSGIPFANSDGVDMLYRHALGSWDVNAQVYIGEAASEEHGYTVDVRQLHGVNVTLGNGTFSARLGYSASRVSVIFDPLVYPPPTTPPNLIEERSYFADAGLTYDDGNWFVAAEAIQFRLDGFIGDTDAGFVSVGHYFGKWLPYVMFSKVNTVNNDDCINTFIPFVMSLGVPAPAAPAAAAAQCKGQEREQTSYSAGFRYDLNKRASLKLEVDHVTDFHDTHGQFALPGTLKDSDSTEVITFNVNATF